MPSRREEAKHRITEAVKAIILLSNSANDSTVAIVAFAAGLKAMGQIFGLESEGDELADFAASEGARILAESDSAASGYSWSPTDV